VHPSKPDFDEAARTECDSGSEGDPEASSLAGSVRHSLSTFGLLHLLSALFLYKTTLRQPALQLLLLWPVLNLIITRSAYNDSCMLHTQPFSPTSRRCCQSAEHAVPVFARLSLGPLVSFNQWYEDKDCHWILTITHVRAAGLRVHIYPGPPQR